MQGIIVKENKKGIYKLLSNRINILTMTKGKLILPECEKLTQIKLMFTEQGEFLIYSEQHKIKLGITENKYWGFNPGFPGYDSQPTLIFIPEKNFWYIHSQGNALIYTEEQVKEFLEIKGL